jgi:hypothetical protein
LISRSAVAGRRIANDADGVARWLRQTRLQRSLHTPEIVSAPVYEDYDSCGSPDDYRSGIVRFDATTRRIAVGEVEDQFEVIAFGDLPIFVSPPVWDIESGSTELWSLRKAGEEWVIVRRLPVTVVSDPNSVPATQGNVDLPAKWSELVFELTKAGENFDMCSESDHGHDDHRRMTDEEFDTWVHNWRPMPGFESK